MGTRPYVSPGPPGYRSITVHHPR